MSDFFDQSTDEEFDDNSEMDMGGSGARIIVNGSSQPLEVGSNFLQAVKQTALQAGFGKFKVYLNGTEIRPSSAPTEITPDMRVEVRPYDEAGSVWNI
jgi:hypothetical protein